MSKEEPRPCLGYTSAYRVVNGVPHCMGCEQPIKDHPIAYRTMAPLPVTNPNHRKK